MQNSAKSSRKLPSIVERTKTVEDDLRSFALEDTLEKHHWKWYQCYDKTLGEGWMDKKAEDPRR